MRDSTKVPLTRPYDGDALIEICGQYFGDRLCPKCEEVTIIIASPCAGLRAWQIALKCEVCDWTEIVGMIDPSGANNGYVTVRRWLPDGGAKGSQQMDDSDERWESI